MNIAANIQQLRQQLPQSVQLVAVSKTRTIEEIREAYTAGQRDFGENKVQELLSKAPLLPPDIHWHLIGHLQTNKVKALIPYVSLIQSVDSIKLLETINKEAARYNRIISCLLQFHIASEESKFGFSPGECREILVSGQLDQMKNVKIKGVMGMATFSSNEVLVAGEFRVLKQIFDEIREDFFSGQKDFNELSMGMSSDYLLAIREGSTMVRIGTSIFGER